MAEERKHTIGFQIWVSAVERKIGSCDRCRRYSRERAALGSVWESWRTNVESLVVVLDFALAAGVRLCLRHPLHRQEPQHRHTQKMLRIRQYCNQALQNFHYAYPVNVNAETWHGQRNRVHNLFGCKKEKNKFD